MKNSIIYLGIALVSLSNVYSASNGLESEKTIFKTDNRENLEMQKVSYLENDNEIKSLKKYPLISEETVFNPETVIPMNYASSIEQTIYDSKKIIEDKTTTDDELVYLEKPIEEVIIAGNQVTESAINYQAELIYIEKPIEDIIASDNQLTESTISTDVYLLDFEKINKKSNTLKNIDNKKIIGMK